MKELKLKQLQPFTPYYAVFWPFYVIASKADPSVAISLLRKFEIASA